MLRDTWRERERERQWCLICCNSAVAGRVWTLIDNSEKTDRRQAAYQTWHGMAAFVCVVGTWEWLKLVVLCVFDSA